MSWRGEFLDAFLRRGAYDPTGRDQKIAELEDEATALRRSVDDLHARHSNCMPIFSGKPRDTDEEKAAEFLAALVHLHQRHYGTWPDADRVRQALIALDIPVRESSEQ